MTIWMGNAGGNWTEADWSLDDPPNGARSVKHFVKFPAPFNKKPAVTCGLTSLDAAQGTNLRARVEVLDVTATGFNMRFTTWGDSVTYGMSASWLAVAF